MTRRWRWYTTAAGAPVARDELNALGPVARAAVLEAAGRVKNGTHASYELESIGKHLQAVRIFLDGCTYRLLFSRQGAHDHVLLSLHVIHKKGRKLPLAARRLAEKRLRDWRARATRWGDP